VINIVDVGYVLYLNYFFSFFYYLLFWVFYKGFSITTVKYNIIRIYLSDMLIIKYLIEF